MRKAAARLVYPICCLAVEVAGLLLCQSARSLRREWKQEWRAELWQGRRQVEAGAIPVSRLLGFACGAFADAAYLRQYAPWTERPLHHAVHSATVCILLLMLCALAGVATLQCARPESLSALQANPAVHLFGFGIAIAVLPAYTRLNLGDPEMGDAPLSTKSLARRWAFLSLKFLLVTIGVFGFTFGAGSLLTAQGVQPHATLIGYVAGFRWALNDQRRRCPVCLRLLEHPAAIGCCAHTFLDLYGTELVCGAGHGLLYRAEIDSSSSFPLRWMGLDASWRSLFRGAARDGKS